MDNLRLRKFREDDFEAFHALCSDYDVVKMLSSWPYPADPEFTRMRMNTPEAQAGLVSVIECDGQLAGTIGGVQGGLGYMLAKPFWGRGIATWAVREKLRECFRNNDWNKIEAGTWDVNPASSAVLLKCGFRKIGESTEFCKARGYELSGSNFELTRADWAATQPLHIETERLVIQPFEEGDGDELANLLHDKRIAQMFRSVSYPFTTSDANDWIAKNNSVGTVRKIVDKNEVILGFVGIVLLDKPYLYYGFGHQYWGSGFASEAARTFVSEMQILHRFDALHAGAMFDNSASQRVLEKLGFVRDGEKMHKPSGRLEEAPLFLYRLDTSKFRTIQ